MEPVNSNDGLASSVLRWSKETLNFDLTDHLTRLRTYGEEHPFMSITLMITAAFAFIPLMCFVFFFIGSILFIFIGALVVEGKHSGAVHP